MKAAYDVFWSQIAESDLFAILEYNSDDSPQRALEILREMRQRVSALRRFPGRGRIVSELENQGITHYRELIVSPWRIIYRISERKAYVLAVMDSRRNVEDILLQRFTGLRV